MAAPTRPSSSAPAPDLTLLNRFLPRGALIWGLLALALLAAGAGFGARMYARAVWERPGPLLAARAIVVPHGGIALVAASLAESGAIDTAAYFRIAAWLTRDGGALRAAEFEFPAHASLRQVLALLRTGHPVEHRVTIPEGLTAYQIANILNHTDVTTGPTGPIEEGSVLPSTYSYEYGMSRTAILTRARAAMDRELTSAWNERAANLPLASSRDALILASIVERETARPEERSHVAAVYLNRLKAGMRLQADPTVAYAASEGTGTLDHRLTRIELERDSPFNTYRNGGLPPGPICSPGPASLRAVTHPMQSDDLYFVADGSGGHVFARTREAHERNVAQWRALTMPVPPRRPE